MFIRYRIIEKRKYIGQSFKIPRNTKVGRETQKPNHIHRQGIKYALINAHTSSAGSRAMSDVYNMLPSVVDL